ncbi:MAG TPA: hypothetical protein VH815_06265 [Acidobacteriota bacterium]
MQDEAVGLNPAPKIAFFLLIVAAMLAALNLTYLFRQTSNPDETSNPESLFILHSVEVSEGKALYTDFRKPPYNVTQYTPVHYFVLAVLKRSFDLNMQQLFIWGRRLMLLMASFIGFAIFLHGKKETRNIIYALTAALIFVGSYMLWPLACTNRADIPATLFSIIAIVIFAQKTKYSLYLSIPFLLLAFYTKHSFVGAPAAIGLYLLLNRQLLKAVTFAAIFAGSTILIWIVMHIVTNGMSTLNLVSTNVAPMKIQNVRLVIGAFLQTAALPLIFGFSGLNRNWKNDPIFIYLFVSLLLALFATAKVGSSMNYLLEPLAAACLLIPSALQRNLDSSAISKTFLTAAFVILAIPQINFLKFTLDTLHFRNDESAKRVAAQASGLVISDNPRISVSSPKPFLVDPYVYSYLESEGKWDSSELLSMIKTGKVQYLILLAPLERPLTWQGVTRLPQGVVKTCSEEFRQTAMVNDYYLYVRKKD